MPKKGVQDYQVILEKNAYFPGETVSGKVLLTTVEPIKCRGIRLKLSGKGYCSFETGSGDNRETRTNTKYYAFEQTTIWGHLFKTAVLDGVGANAHFGAPWAPNEGLMCVPIDCTGAMLIVRAMDYDIGKKDDLLCETVLNVDEVVAKTLSEGQVTLSTTYKGKPSESQITVSATWDELTDSNTNSFGFVGASSTTRFLKLLVISATNLRKADMFGKNDVYVQAYFTPPGESITNGKALPPPLKQSTLEPQTITYPFNFQLPNDLPSSADFGWNYIRYSVYSHIDIKWKCDPSARALFTVLQPIASFMPGFDAPLVFNEEKTTYPALCCIEFTCFPKGSTRLEVNGKDGRSFAPGEPFSLDINAINNSTKTIQVRAFIKRKLLLYAEGYHHSTDTAVFNEVIGEIPQGNNLKVLHTIVMPEEPPTFQGLNNQAAAAFLEKYKRNWSETRQRLHENDPLRWSYKLLIKLCIPFCKDVRAKFPIVIASIPRVMKTLVATEQPSSAVPSAPNGSDATIANWQNSVSLDKLQHANPQFHSTTNTSCAVKDETGEDSLSFSTLQYQPQYLKIDFQPTVQKQVEWPSDVHAKTGV